MTKLLQRMDESRTVKPTTKVRQPKAQLDFQYDTSGIEQICFVMRQSRQ